MPKISGITLLPVRTASSSRCHARQVHGAPIHSARWTGSNSGRELPVSPRPGQSLRYPHRRPVPPAAGRRWESRNGAASDLVDLLRRYWNRSDLLEQLRGLSVILSGDSLVGEGRPTRTVGESGALRSRWLRDRFSAEELQAMVDLYCSGVPAGEVAEKYSVSLRSVKRLLQKRGARRRGAA